MNITQYDVSVPSDSQFEIVQGASSNSLKVYANENYVYVYVSVSGNLSTLNSWTDTGLVINDEQYRPPNTLANSSSNQKNDILIRANAYTGKIEYFNAGSALASGATTLCIFFYPRKSSMP